MKVSREEVLRIAALSRLRFDENELEMIGEHIDNIVERFHSLDCVDVSDVPPTAHVLPFTNVLRDDEAKAPMERDRLLAGAPDSDGTAYIVPRVVE